MAPEQVRLLPVTDRAVDYCREQAAKLTNMGFRVTFGKRGHGKGGAFPMGCDYRCPLS